MKRLAALPGMLSVIVVGISPAHAIAVPTNWWSNQTSSADVNEFGPEGVRLWNAYTGYIEGTVALPQWGVWDIAFRAHTDETADLPSEYIRVFVNNTLVQEIYNTPPKTHFQFDHLIAGDSFQYRFEFSSPRRSYDSHMVMDPGSVTLVSPDVTQAAPSIAEIWPPNNKMVDITILGVTDPNGAPVTIAITGITDNEGSDPADVGGIGSSTAQVRAQRDGAGSGRIYTICFTASDGQAESRGSVQVAVPHDQGKDRKKGAAKPTAGVDPTSWGAIKGVVR